MKALIGGGESDRALDVFDAMEASKARVDHVTLVVALKACVEATDFRKGVRIYNKIWPVFTLKGAVMSHKVIPCFLQKLEIRLA